MKATTTHSTDRGAGSLFRNEKGPANRANM